MTCMSRCARCKVLKPADDFHRHPSNRDGLQSRCKACLQAVYRANRVNRIEYARQQRWEDQRIRMASDARRRDREAGRKTNIKAKDIIVPEFCPVTQRPMFHAVDAPLGCSPCLVRVDKSLGYIPGNWIVVSADTQPNMKRRVGTSR